ncbi:hypothetical protein [Kitasatospora sp. NPDC085879]
MTCTGMLGHGNARFTAPQVTREAAAPTVTFDRTAFQGSATLRLRYARLH